MVVHVTLRTKVCLFSYTIEFGQLWWNFATILAVWRLGDQLLMGIDSKIYQVHREDLIVFIYDILMLVQLDIFLLIVQVN
jgi:hypothetical protein